MFKSGTNKLLSALNMVDVYTLAMLFIYNCLYISFFNRIPNSVSGLAINTLFIVIIFIVANKTSTMNLQGKKMLFRKLYFMPIAYYIYSHIFDFVKVINPKDYDDLLSVWDRAILGMNVPELFASIQFPLLTEYLQITYFMFFFYPIFLGAEFSFKGEISKLEEYAKTIIFGFYFSYLLYLLLPAVGPRFYLHNFANLDSELPGIILSPYLRNIINVGGGIIDPSNNPMAQVNRDCFPSGHTMMTFMTILLAFRYNSKFKYIVLVLGSSLIISTLYMRYHYLVDMIAGLFFGALSLYIEPKISRYLKHHLLKK